MAPAPAQFDAGQPVDLEASLLGGQAHRWKREGDWYSGVLRGVLVLIRQHGQAIEFLSSPSDPQAMIPRIREHLRLDDDLPAIQAEISSDSNVAAQVERYPGLRVLRQDPWECLDSLHLLRQLQHRDHSPQHGAPVRRVWRATNPAQPKFSFHREGYLQFSLSS